jgi:hypothetical protein
MPVPPSTVPDRFRRRLDQAAARLGLSGEDPGLELAGRFGLRRYFERIETADPDNQQSLWLERARRLRKESRNVTTALTSARIPHFFFKGIALVGRFYRIEERQLADIDVFVPPAQRNAALAVLHALGYGDLRDSTDWRPDASRPGLSMRRGSDGAAEDEALLDVHWGLESVAALSPEATVTVPDTVWRGVTDQGGLPVPHDEHHLALVLHHLVRHDLLHVRGLLDLALLWDALPHAAGQEAVEVASALGVHRALAVVGRALVDGVGAYPLRGVTLTSADWRRRLLTRRLGLEDWLVWAARHAADGPAHVIISVRRAWWRWLLSDEASAGRLVREVLVPEADYLRWRWPDAGSTSAWFRHLRASLRD